MSDGTEPPCIGLHPDTDPCPFCGAWLSDECKNPAINRMAEGGDVG